MMAKRLFSQWIMIEYDKELKSLTKLSRKYQVFGVPIFIYNNERFWGQDRVKVLAEKMNL